MTIRGADLLVDGGRMAGGTGSVATGANSFAYGNAVSALGGGSFAAGDRAVAQKYRQFVWNGADSEYDPFESYGASAGTFCVNPQDGANGFYIGGKTLSGVISDSCAAIKSVIANSLTAAGIEKDTPLSAISLASVLSAIHNLQAFIDA